MITLMMLITLTLRRHYFRCRIDEPATFITPLLSRYCCRFAAAFRIDYDDIYASRCRHFISCLRLRVASQIIYAALTLRQPALRR